MNNDNHLTFRMLAQVDEIDAGWASKDDTLIKEYVSLSIAAPDFGAKIWDGNFGEEACSDDKNLYAAIWNLADQTKAPAQVLHGDNQL